MSKNNDLVVVLSRNYATGLSVIRSLGTAGYTVDLVASAYKPGASVVAEASKYVRKSVEVVSKKVSSGYDRELVKALLAYADEVEDGKKPVLFPTDDYTASIMDCNRNELSRIFVMPEIVGGGQGEMTRRMRKTIQSRLAEKAGVPVANEWSIPLDKKIEIPYDITYPCFVKPIESVTGYKREMKKCENLDELQKHLKRLKRNFPDRSILVQEYIDIVNEIDFSGVCLDQKIIIPAIIRKTNVAQYETGVTLSGQLIPLEEMNTIQDNVVNIDGIQNSIIEMMKSFHYFGMFDYELSIARRTNQTRCIEKPRYIRMVEQANADLDIAREQLKKKKISQSEFDRQSAVFDATVAISDFEKSFYYAKRQLDRDIVRVAIGDLTIDELKKSIRAYSETRVELELEREKLENLVLTNELYAQKENGEVIETAFQIRLSELTAEKECIGTDRDNRVAEKIKHITEKSIETCYAIKARDDFDVEKYRTRVEAEEHQDSLGFDIDRLCSELGANIVDTQEQYYVIQLPKDDNLYIFFNEVNLRSGGPNYSYYKSGVNLPELFVKEALGYGHTEAEENVESFYKNFVYEKIAWEDHIHGYMSKRELEDCINNSDITLLKDADDVVPYDVFIKQLKEDTAAQRKRNVRRVIRRTIKNTKRFLRPIFRAVFRVAKRFVNPIRFRILGYPQYKRANKRDPYAETPRVLVSGRNYCSNLTMARALGKAGYEVEILRIYQVKPKLTNPMKKMRPDAHSQYIKAYYELVTRRKDKAIFKRLVKLADPNHKMLLIPADDLVAHVADQYYDKLKRYYVMPNVDNEAGRICSLMEKGVQKELALNFGLPVLHSVVINVNNESYRKNNSEEIVIPDSVTYPCFIKPNVSRKSSKSRMRKCESEQELRFFLELFSKKKPIEMLVEQYVEIDREYSILGVSTKDGVIGPGYFGAKVGGQKEHRGVAVVGEILPTSEEQALIDRCVAFIKSLNYEGLYDVDLIKTTSGEMYFVELNLRFGASGYAYADCGINLPGMFADYMLKNIPIDMDAKLDEKYNGKLFVSEKVLIEEYLNSRLTKSCYNEYMNDDSIIHFVKDKDDPAAYRHFKRFLPIATLMRAPLRKKNELTAEEERRKEAEMIALMQD